MDCGHQCPSTCHQGFGKLWEGSLDTAIVAREVLNLDEYEFGKKASGTGPRTLLESQTGEHPLCYEPVDRLCLGANSWFVATSIPRHNLII